MHRNPVWLGFLLLFALVTAWYAGDAIYKIYRYDQLTASVEPSTINLEVVTNGSGRYYYKGIYTVEIDSQTYSGSEQLLQPIFRNQASAEALLQEYLNDPWVVWYAPNNPLHSTIQKNYPLKELIYGLALVALFCYFLWLGFKVADQSREVSNHGNRYIKK
jgi:hypothetical protein